jgi:amidase
MFSGLVAEHAVTRSVRDSAALLDASAGPEVGDPYFAPSPARPFIEEVGAAPGRLRIAFAAIAPSGVALHDDCVAAVRDAAKLCSELGHEVEEASPRLDMEIVIGSFMALWAAGCTWQIDGIARQTGRPVSEDQFEPGTWTLYQMGTNVSGSRYLEALETLQAMSRQVGQFFVDYDLWLTPTLGTPPPPLGHFDSTEDDPLRGMRRSAEFVPFTPIINATGQPAMSIPLFWNSEGLPVGAHFVARFGDEATLFRLASQLEEARPWKDRRPPEAV